MGNDMARTFCAAVPVGFESKIEDDDDNDNDDNDYEQKDNADVVDDNGTKQDREAHASGSNDSEAVTRKYLVEGGMRLCTSCFWIYHRYPRQLIQSEGMANKILDLAKSKQVGCLNR